jgi:serine O-acetyltransferase
MPEAKVISSIPDLQLFLQADKVSLGIRRSRPTLFGDEIWKFQRLLRKVEYCINCQHSVFFKPIEMFYRARLHYLGIRLGFTISPNNFGPGLSIAHRGTIVVNNRARIGANCRIHTCVNIGEMGEHRGVPTIGDSVYIGPGAKIFGDVVIADHVTIGANAVVNKSFLQPGVTIAGVPARIVGYPEDDYMRG